MPVDQMQADACNGTTCGFYLADEVAVPPPNAMEIVGTGPAEAVEEDYRAFVELQVRRVLQCDEIYSGSMGCGCFTLLMHRPPHVDSGPYIGRKQRGVRVRPRLWHK